MSNPTHNSAPRVKQVRGLLITLALGLLGCAEESAVNHGTIVVRVSFSSTLTQIETPRQVRFAVLGLATIPDELDDGRSVEENNKDLLISRIVGTENGPEYSIHGIPTNQDISLIVYALDKNSDEFGFASKEGLRADPDSPPTIPLTLEPIPSND